MADKHITEDIMKAYIQILEKQVSQMTTVVSTLGELNEKLDKIESHFTNGFRSEIMEHTTKEISEVMGKIEKTLTTIYLIKQGVDNTTDADKTSVMRSYEQVDDIKEKIGSLQGDIKDVSSTLKTVRAINIIGWASFIFGILTMVLKLFGKI